MDIVRFVKDWDIYKKGDIEEFDPVVAGYLASIGVAKYITINLDKDIEEPLFNKMVRKSPKKRGKQCI